MISYSVCSQGNQLSQLDGNVLDKISSVMILLHGGKVDFIELKVTEVSGYFWSLEVFAQKICFNQKLSGCSYLSY